jgi:predicted nuclease of restriction endonuclease-like (RecB) superfamily
VQIPWWHNVVIVSKCKDTTEALYYVNKTIKYNWSRNVLTHQIESGLYQREGKAVTNFTETLPAPQSDLAQQLIKDPYTFDFLTLTDDYNERELEKALTGHITIGLLLCKSHDKVVVEYALSDIQKPMGVSEYQLTRALPENLKPSLPTIEELEAEFNEHVQEG